MDSKIIVTDDNSKTLMVDALNETYHSTKGAITESKHVFIKEGLQFINKNELTILEMGFGTGLNAILSFVYAIENNVKIHYTTIEAYPLDYDKVKKLSYLENMHYLEWEPLFKKMHGKSTSIEQNLHSNFTFKKLLEKIEDTQLPKEKFDLIYYDAFGPKIQPHLWQTDILSQFAEALKEKGALTTYCAQGQFKRNLKSLGLDVHSIPGPPGKREMTRAIKKP